MNRKDFIRNCGLICLGASSAGTLLSSCITTKSITAPIIGNRLVIKKVNFIKSNKNIDYLIVENQQLQYPICVFRLSDTNYKALYMRCTHRGSQLSAYGDKLVCSAHGSEFNNKGQVTQGPATQALKSFHMQIDEQNIYISLKRT
ncbi:MAG: Rieske (2Fe-2S) protein [Tenacibaculum sp.]